jgi:hypothetical protein
MKNKIMMLLGLLLMLPTTVWAASGSIKATVSSSKVTLNNTITVTVKVSSTDTLGSWQYGLSYDKSKLSLISGDPSIVGYGDGTYSSKSYTYKFKAIAVGNATITIDNPKIVDWNSESAITTSKSDLTLTIKEPVIINYSSDNNLASLKVEGFTISPEFNKSTLEYSATVNADTTSVNIVAKTNDSKAKMSGTGKMDVVEGTNQAKIVVTAENGTSKTYVINITVPEKDPINYKFGQDNYNILRKLPENLPLNFNKATIKFNDEEVPCLQNEKLNITLIYLRNSKNEENFYIYDASKKLVNIYNEVKNNDITIYLTNKEVKVKGYNKRNIKINGVETSGYQLSENSKDFLVMGRNVSTGQDSIFVYDSVNKTISLFNEDDYNYLVDETNLYKMITYALGALLGLLLLIVILLASSRKKLIKLINKTTMAEKVIEEKQEEKTKKKKNTKKEKNKHLDNNESQE